MLTAAAGFGLAAAEWVAEGAGRRRTLPPASGNRAGFTPVAASVTGITFTNLLSEARSLTNHILMNGSGVALGDMDGDGWCDVFLAGLDGRSALYRNLGNWKFEDVTAAALRDGGDPEFSLRRLEASGAVFADLDGDGFLELLVNAVGKGTRLWRNDGSGRFHDDTRAAGLESRSGPSSFALADVDGDGDLDLYVVHYRSSTVRDALQQQFRMQVVNGRPVVAAVNGRPTSDPDLVGRFSVDAAGRITEHGEADRLLLNDGQGRFAAVPFTGGAFRDEQGAALTQSPYDWGLAAMFRDINRDGFPDLYVCNDLGSPDRCWLGDGKGGFRAIPRLALRKTSWFSMGVDFGDLDRDGNDDFIVTDMLSRDWVRRQTDLAEARADEEPYPGVERRPQTARNTVFAGRGDGTFAEVAWWSGLAASDWSWSPVILDVDLDGLEDVLVTTGFQRDVQDADVAEEMERIRQRDRLSDAAAIQLRLRFPALSQPNLAFRNRGNLTFEELGTAWGFEAVGISQGMALADLDRDGDLDCVINEQNGPARLLRNDCPAPRLAVRLKGPAGNRSGIGGRITVTGGPVPQAQEMISGGRYLSGDEALRVFAAGDGDRRLTVRVRWRSGRESVWDGVPAQSEIEVDESSAVAAAPTSLPPVRPLFQDVSDRIRHRHEEAPFDEAALQPLLPRSLSRLGPAVAWGDLNSDGADDLVLGSGRGGRLGVFLNDGRGGFTASAAGMLERPAATDHAGVLIHSRAGRTAEVLLGLSRYEGAGSGGFRRLDLATGELRLGGGGMLPGALGPMAMADVNGDGALDLFLGGRALPGRYPEATASALLLARDGTWAPDVAAGERFARLGLVTGALFPDLDADGDPDLVVSCEWGPIRIFWNEGGVFGERELLVRWTEGTDRPARLGDLTGGWQGIVAADLDEDGRLDLVAANWGANTPRQEGRIPGVGRRLLFGDLDANGTVEVLETRWDPAGSREVLAGSRSRLTAAWPDLAARYPTRRSLASAPVADVLGSVATPVGSVAVSVLESVILLNRGDHFEVRVLPPTAQWAPGTSLAAADFDGDGHEDLFLGQNASEEAFGEERLDSGLGLWLRGDGRGSLEAVPPLRSGIRIPGEQRAAAVADFDQDGRPDLVVGQNSEATHLYRNEGGTAGLRIRLRQPGGNPDGIGTQVRWISGGKPVGPVREVRAGSGYWSQDSPVMVFPRPVQGEALQIRWPGRPASVVSVPAEAREIEASPSGIRVVR